MNGQTDSSLSVSISSAPASISAITPNSVSPVLKQILTLSVASFTGTLDIDDLSVYAVATTNPSIVRYINVVEVGNDSGNQYIKVKFGGSESGLYNVFVRSRAYGRFDTTGITLKLIGVVTDYNPKQGSVHGGTLITITGYHFSNDY